MKREREMKYDRGHHCKYLLQYHIIWSTKFRYPVLDEYHQESLKRLIRQICMEEGFLLLAIEAMPEHIHVFLSSPPAIAPAEIVRRLKGKTAHWLLQNDQELRRFYSRSRKLWGRGYYIASVGHANAEAVEKYIKEQHSHHEKEEKEK